MVGLNHEFARELLWREYPTDQRGSYFRQFWDVARLPGRARAPTRRHCASGCATSPSCTAGRPTRGLGDHDHREAQGDKEDEVVLVIRGELLKKYPTAVIYAHRAAWERTGDGAIDKTKPRSSRRPRPPARPPRDLVKTPLYEAKVDPDIYFFGFDLTAENAKGGQHRRRRGGSRLVLRHQGASRRAALRARPARRARPRRRSTPGTSWPGPT